MDGRLTLLETDLVKTLENVKGYMTGTKTKVSAHDFMELMGGIKMVLIRAENVKYGCGSGAHSSPCHCQRRLITDGIYREGTQSSTRV